MSREPPAAQVCPICNGSVHPNPRYPRYVCEDCVMRATASNGRAVKFTNADTHGGRLGIFRDGGGTNPDGHCIIDGMACWAEEARFGGIVVQPIGPQWPPRF